MLVNIIPSGENSGLGFNFRECYLRLFEMRDGWNIRERMG